MGGLESKVVWTLPLKELCSRDPGGGIRRCVPHCIFVAVGFAMPKTTDEFEYFPPQILIGFATMLLLLLALIALG
jgi:hypothetical protein